MISPVAACSTPVGAAARPGRCSLRPWLWRVLLAVIALGGAGCGAPSSSGRLLQQIQADGELVVVTRNAPTTYYVGRDGLAGPEYDMAVSFAEHLGVDVRFEIVDNLEDIFKALEQGEAHIAAAGLTLTEHRRDRFLAGPAYQQVRQQVVCRRGGKRPNDVEELTEVELLVVAESSYVDALMRLREDYPELRWKTVDDMDTEKLLEHVWLRKTDCTIADSNIVAINRRYHPELVVTFDLTEPESLVWYMPKDGGQLQEAVEDWFEEFNDGGELAQVKERYYGFVRIFDYVDTRRFVRRVQKRLPRYKELFEGAAEKHNIEWTLLAAQAYQESHWRPRAKSPTGVRGIMMLTLRTARELGVNNRLDPKQSIFGGARYLKQLRKRLPDSVQEPDRTWMALAAYNVGMGHIWDARRLAKQLDKDPDTWADMKTVLPLLSQKRYYKGLKYGYARGNEPVRYVARIRDFEDLLLEHLEPTSAAR